LELPRIKCPVLILRARFTASVLEKSVNSYVKPQFIDTWDDAHDVNPLITVKDIPDAASFLWMDSPDAVNAEIRQFVTESKHQ
jgi:pimeloyl-ACP methyl ester carboxylesterase